MKRIRLNPYGKSKSGRALARYLGIKRLKLNNSKFKGRPNDVVINWGNARHNLDNVGRARQINKLENVQLASNKLHTLYKLADNNIPVPKFSTDKSELVPERLYMARTTLTGHSGRGIVIGYPEELPMAPLYTEYINKVAEYRAIVVGNKIVDFKKKLKKRDWEGERDEYIWNHSNGYIFARNFSGYVPTTISNVCINAVSVLGLDFGAVDIIEDETGNVYVLEINTAFGIEGTTLELVGNAIKELL